MANDRNQFAEYMNEANRAIRALHRTGSERDPQSVENAAAEAEAAYCRLLRFQRAPGCTPEQARMLTPKLNLIRTHLYSGGDGR